MVTEMTGGYTLLVPAALAVMLSFLLQVTFSSGLRYKSLYEAQLPERADSPSHHKEQLQAAVHLLGIRGLSVPTTIDHLDLRALLTSGIPVDLPDGKSLLLGALKPKNSWAGEPLSKVLPGGWPR